MHTLTFEDLFQIYSLLSVRLLNLATIYFFNLTGLKSSDRYAVLDLLNVDLKSACHLLQNICQSKPSHDTRSISSKTIKIVDIYVLYLCLKDSYTKKRKLFNEIFFSGPVVLVTVNKVGNVYLYIFNLGCRIRGDHLI